MKELSKGQELEAKLFGEEKNAPERMTDEQIAQADAYCEDYKKFLDAGKTEREVAAYSEKMLVAAGYKKFTPGMDLKPGDKVYSVNRGKAIIASTIGSGPITDGVRIAAAHIDSPRLDLKQHPMYENRQLALLKTHYYGGIKKYQWAAMPLAMHGVLVKKGGEKVEICIGESADDPVFCVTDLLPHLADDQMKRTLHDGIRGEELNILVGSRPFRDDKVSHRVKLNIMNILFEKYGVTERDFISAELELVPAFKAQDVGFDRSMLGAYGHDDRVCAYTALTAEIATQAPKYTTVTILADKEETGSDGNTGLNSSYLRFFIADIADCFGAKYRHVLTASKCLSADVNAAFDPTFPDVTEPMNSAFINRGVCMTKYTGARGKSGTSDASAEFVGMVRDIFDKADIIWQTAELGKVDQGGGGTVAMYIANLDVDVVDVGVPVLSMHAPFEVVSKIDVHMAYRAFTAFYE